MLVVTLLGILFVVGVAFLATMNFEADMIAATRDRTLSENGVDSAVSDATTILRNSVMAGPGIPFGDSSAALSGSAFAELPGVHNSFSPIEPIRRYGADQAAFTPDDSVVFNGYFDAQAHRGATVVSPSLPPVFEIDTNRANGDAALGVQLSQPSGPPIEVSFGRCKGGADAGKTCSPTEPCTLPSICEYPRIADADGDGIVDSLLVDAKSMGLSDAQLADLAAKVNPATNLGGRVSVALRVIPHGGMVNLNESHPRMIQTVFDIPDTLWPIPTDTTVDPNLGFRHGPTQDLVSYSPTLEEQLLRRRGMIPSRQLQPSLLHGSSLAANANATGAHMPRQLFWWSRASGQQDVFPVLSETAGKKGHRFTPFTPTELYPDEPNFYYWSVMMEPTTANQAAAAPPPWNASGTDLGYDRRHLVTTISHDDLLARTAKIKTWRGEMDLREAMTDANQFEPGFNDPNGCEPAVPFEYVYYPLSGTTNKGCCKEDVDCRPDRGQGRLQLSLPWIDEELAAASVSSLSPAEQRSYRERIYRVIHDVFFMLVRNATQATAVEGMACQTDDDCPYVGTICLRDNNVPPDPPGYFLPDQKGTCVYELNAAPASFTNSDPSMPTGCLAASCGVPESLCGDDGICRLAAPAWRDVECPVNACSTGEFCRLRCVGGANAGDFCEVPGDCAGGACGPGGLCADNLTRQPRSQALLSRTAASLTANLIDYADADNVPTRIALRDFDFSKPYAAGREIDTNTILSPKKYCSSNADCDTNAPVCSVFADGQSAARWCIKPVYVYGLERQPYITEVTTLAQPTDPWPLVGWAIELINPYDFPITLTNDYFIVQAPAGALTLNGLARVPLNGAIPLNDQSLTPGPFSVVYSIANPGFRDTLLTPVTGPGFEISGLDFENNATIYLVRRVQYPDDTQPTEIVVDQIVVGQAGGFIGKSGTDLSALNPACLGPTNPPPCRFSVQRVVPNLAGLWTSPIPDSTEVTEGEANLGTWNNVRGINPNLHPVQVDFANTGSFGISTSTTALPAYPTTGSMLAIMRHANRSVADYVSPNGVNPELSFGSNLVGTMPVRVTYRDQASGLMAETPVNFTKEGEIDNGRLPIFDVGPIPTNNNVGLLGMHHLQPALFKAWDASGTNPNLAGRGIPGDLNTLPWGQLIFDYFTALPLSNGGPYDFDSAGNYLSIPEVPRVDRDGLRVHGRLNINAAPWKALAGLPLVPMDLAAGSPFTVSFQGLPTSIRDRLNGILDPGGTGAQTVIGEDLAKAIVAYRDARSFNDNAGTSITGNYNYEFLVTSGVAQTTGRGWANQLPAFRRGTGFMSVGELANVRHPGSATITVPPAAPYRIDSGEIDNQPTANRNDQDFLAASALLMAMGDWVSVRSHVFTVYGQIRGADDPDVAALYANPAEQAAALIADTDARAIRFQETIDRFPVLEGRARPQRIGERTVGSYTDVNND